MTRLSHNRLLERRIALTVLLLAVFALVLPHQASANQFKRIRDVNVSCNNALRCDIYITNRRVTLSSFGFRRAAAPGADVQITLGSRQPLRAGSDVVFSVDGNDILSIPAADFSYRAATYEYFYNVQDDVVSLLRAARAGGGLEISYTTRSGRSTVPFSLSGMTAGLIFADEVQGRIGDDDALMAKSAAVRARSGANPVADASMREITSWDDVPGAVRSDFEGENARCAGGAANSAVPPMGGFEVSLDDDVRLLALVCGGAGAYNAPFSFWVSADQRVSPVALPVMTDEGPSATDIAWNVSFDPATRELVEFFKGRGIGDCGMYNRRKLVGEFGELRFVLIEARVKDDCDGIYKEDYSDYARLWPLP